MGYAEGAIDPALGFIEFPALYQGPHGGEVHVFRAQLHSDGWVTLLVNGPRARRAGDVLIVPSALRREYEQLALAMTPVLVASGTVP